MKHLSVSVAQEQTKKDKTDKILSQTGILCNFARSKRRAVNFEGLLTHPSLADSVGNMNHPINNLCSRSEPDAGPEARHDKCAPSAGGAPPGNTAPQKYTPDQLGLSKQVPGAVDSLYLSFAGTLAEQVIEDLHDRKQLAQASEDEARLLAQYRIGEHLFAVGDKGRRRAEFVLRNPYFTIDVSRGGGIPLAYVQIASSYLTAAGVEDALSVVRFVVGSLGTVVGDEKVSRVDLCVDFVPTLPPYPWPNEWWVTRATRVDTHTMRGHFTGWSFGLGGDVSGRLYDKRHEVNTVSGKAYLLDVWGESDISSDESVWRLEFQLKRGALKEMGINTVAQATERLGDLWTYCCTKWLTLRVPGSEPNRSRWGLAPLWASLSDAVWDARRFAVARTRDDGRMRNRQAVNIFRGVLSSFMADSGIEHFDQGLGEFLHVCDALSLAEGHTFPQTVRKKALVKAAQLCTRDNRRFTESDAARTAGAARAYRAIRERVEPDRTNKDDAR